MTQKHNWSGGPKHWFNMRIPVKLHEQIKQKAIEQNKTIATIIIEYVIQGIESPDIKS